MFRWMLPQRDKWNANGHGGVQKDALQKDLWMHMNTPLGSDGCSTEGPVDACEHLETPFRWIPRQRDLLRNLNDALGLLWMLPQRDL